MKTKTTLVVCPECGLDAVFEFEDGGRCAKFSAVNAMAMLIAFTRERKISFSNAGRLLLEIDQWCQGIPEDIWRYMTLKEMIIAVALHDLPVDAEDLPN